MRRAVAAEGDEGHVLLADPLIVLVALCHYMLTTRLLLRNAGSVMGRFDAGRPPSAADQVFDVVGRALMFPLVDPIGDWLPLLRFGDGNLLFAANSLLWALLLIMVARRMRRRDV